MSTLDPFEQVPIGETGVTVSQLGFGSVFVGGREHGDGTPASEYETALGTIQTAYELGIRYFDTAPFYGRGRSEVRVGRALSRESRESFTLSSKVGRVLEPDPQTPGVWAEDGIAKMEARFDMSRDGILRALDDGLARHRLGHLDIVYLHDADWEDLEDEAIATALPTLVELREQGVVKAIGVGMNQWEMPARFMRHFHLDIVLLAGRYTLLDQSAYADFLPRCVAENTKIALGGPYNSGILATRDLSGDNWFNYKPAESHWVERAKAIQSVCRQFEIDMRAAALQFPVAHPAVATVIPGAATPMQVRENVELFQSDIPSELWTELKAASLLPEDAPVPG